MPTPVSIFLDFNLPNATTWFYFSFLLAVALFFKFSRLLSMRNLDVVMIFLLVPGLLVVQGSRPQPGGAERDAAQIAALVGRGACHGSAVGLATPLAQFTQEYGPALEHQRWLWYGYAWLLLGSIYFFLRCVFDLILVQRPALAPNLQTGGLAWLAGALLVCMLAVAYRQAERQLNPAPPPNGTHVAVPLPQPPEQTVFAVAILWKQWPAWGVTVLAFVCHTVVLVNLAIIGWRHFQDLAAGMGAATFYLLLPYMGASVGQIHHVLPMALFLGAVVAYRWPTLAGAILGLATAATYFPAFVLPIWLSFYRERGLGRFLAAFLLALALGLLNIGLSLEHQGQLDKSIQLAVDSAAWQPLKTPSTEGFWTANIWAYRIPVFLVFLVFVIMTMFWPYPKNLAHVIALSAAVFIGLQWWCADQGGAYVLWYMPLLLLLVFRPNLQDRVPPAIAVETDWLYRSLHWLARGIRRLARRSEPVKASAS
jgi:hypothetical protein